VLVAGINSSVDIRVILIWPKMQNGCSRDSPTLLYFYTSIGHAMPRKIAFAAASKKLFFDRNYGDWSCELVALIHMSLWISGPIMQCLTK
jgi:hypothetical protein